MESEFEHGRHTDRHTDRTDRAADCIQRIRMEELGKALTNRCQAVRILSAKTRRRKTQMGTRDRSINCEQLEYECQLKTSTRSQIQELLNLGTSSPHNLIERQILGELEENPTD